MTGPERLLVRLPNWLGDALLARPLLHGLRRALPGAAILAVGPAPLLELLQRERTFDRACPWPARDRRANGNGVGAARRAAHAFRPDAAVVLPPSFSSAWFAWRSGAAVRVGYGHEGRSPLLTHALRRPARGELHLSREYLALGATFGAREGPLPALPVDAGAVEKACDRLGARAQAGRPLALLAPGAAYGPAKRWMPERFAALGRTLVERGLAVLVCGAEAERAVCESVAREIAGARSLAGETDLLVQAALCAMARVVVSNDSGLAHLAGAVGAPTVAIFGSTSSAWSAPLGPRVRVVQHPPVCAPCFQRTCRIGYRCLAAVGVDEVADACAALPA